MQLNNGIERMLLMFQMKNGKWDILTLRLATPLKKILRTNHPFKGNIEIGSSFAKVSSKCGRLLRNS